MNRPYAFLCAAMLAASVVAGPAALAAKHDRGTEPLTCENGDWNGDGRASFCEVRETTLKDFGGSIDADPGLNGGVSVQGWDRDEALVRARVRTFADTDAAAADLAKQVRIDTAGGRIHGEGPAQAREMSWAVTLQIFVPRRSNVAVRTTNGGIALGDLSGEVRFEALNGGVALSELGGDVRGHTTNGGLAVTLSGDRWDGEALDVYSVNGGVNLEIPQNYSAQLETGTEHGGMSLDYPITVQGKVSKRIAVTLGSGGPLVRVVTTNGGIKIHQAG